MSSNDAKQQARSKREAAAATAAARQQRARNLKIGGGVIAAALVAVLAVILLAGGDDGPAPDAPPVGVAETTQLLDGIPQQGLTLGDPKAPVTIYEFVDLQCPFCSVNQLDNAPKVINEAVRTGKAKLVLQPLAFLGDDSVAGRAVLLRLARRDQAWQFANLFFFNQGTEGTGYVTDAFLRKLTGALPATAGVPLTRTPDAQDEQVIEQVESRAKAEQAKADKQGTQFGTPWIAVGKSDAPLSTYTSIQPGGSGEATEILDAVNAATAAQR